jgi:hypothetical protein
MKLQQSQAQQEITTQISNQELEMAIAVAFERTATEFYNIQNMVKDVINEFGDVQKDDIIKAIRNGGLGMYGKTYKLSTQEICIWIRSYLKEKERLATNPYNLPPVVWEG